MSLESFYGGKQGISPVIKKSFKYVSKNDAAYLAQQSKPDKSEVMSECFADNNYQDVWYNELCIIDNRNSDENGKLFKRTLRTNDYNGNSIYAEYIGKLSGPAGRNSKLAFGGYSDTNALYRSKKNDPGNYIVYGKSDGTISTNINLENLPMIDLSVDLVKGDSENNSIKYGWFNVTDIEGEDTTTFLGLQIPSHSFDFNTETVSWTENASIQEIKGSSNNFYHKLKMIIPRGVRGDNIKTIRVAKLGDFQYLNKNNEEVNTQKPLLSDINSVSWDIETGETLNTDITTWKNKEDLLTDSSLIWVCDYSFYKEGSTEVINYVFYLGRVAFLKQIRVTEEGNVEVISDAYGDNEEDEDIYTLTTPDGKPFIVNYIEDVRIDDRNHLVVYHSSASKRPVADPEAVNDNINVNYKTMNNRQYRDGIQVNDLNITANDYWQDLGPVSKVARGLKVTCKFDFSNYPAESDSSIAEGVSTVAAILERESGEFERISKILEILNSEEWGTENNKVSNPYCSGFPIETGDSLIGRENFFGTLGLIDDVHESVNGILVFYNYDPTSSMGWVYFDKKQFAGDNPVDHDEIAFGKNGVGGVVDFYSEQQLANLKYNAAIFVVEESNEPEIQIDIQPLPNIWEVVSD